MGQYRYSVELAEKTANAQAHDLNVSYKDLTQVCGAIRGKTAAEARKILEECISMKKAIPYRKFNKGCGHRSELGGKKGRYPKKEAKIMLGLLNDAEANARYRGMDEKKLFVAQAAAFKQDTFKRYRRFWVGGPVLGYGKQAIWADYATARAEIMLCEKEPRPGDEKKPAKAEKEKTAGQKAVGGKNQDGNKEKK